MSVHLSLFLLNDISYMSSAEQNNLTNQKLSYTAYAYNK